MAVPVETTSLNGIDSSMMVPLRAPGLWKAFLLATVNLTVELRRFKALDLDFFECYDPVEEVGLGAFRVSGPNVAEVIFGRT